MKSQALTCAALFYGCETYKLSKNKNKINKKKVEIFQKEKF
jgi:hypothetical protein